MEAAITAIIQVNNNPLANLNYNNNKLAWSIIFQNQLINTIKHLLK